jgi:hypothetical protein
MRSPSDKSPSDREDPEESPRLVSAFLSDTLAAQIPIAIESSYSAIVAESAGPEAFPENILDENELNSVREMALL